MNPICFQSTPHNLVIYQPQVPATVPAGNKFHHIHVINERIQYTKSVHNMASFIYWILFIVTTCCLSSYNHFLVVL